MMQRIVLFVVGAIMMACSCQAGSSDDGRKVYEANKGAVVTVQVVVEISMSYEGQTRKEEEKKSATGTVIDRSGLTVASLMEIDPSAFAPEEAEASYSASVVSAKLRTIDGTEIPADVVLRDKDMDLAFLRPKTAPANPLPFVDLSQSAAPQVLDELVVLGTLGKSVNYSVGATIDRVSAVVTKPRTFYAISSAPPGGVAFTLDGKAAGVALWRTSAVRPDESDGDAWQLIVLPSETVTKAAQQAKAAVPAPAPEPKPAN